VTSYSCILYQVHPDSDGLTIAMISFECSVRGNSNKKCGVSGRYKDQTALVPFKTRSKDVSDH